MDNEGPTAATGTGKTQPDKASAPGSAMPGRRETIAFLVLLAVGVSYLVSALQLPLWSGRRPGSGLFPLVVAVVIVASSVAAVILHRRHRDSDSAPTADDGSDAGDGSEREFGQVFWKVPALVGCLAAFVVLVERFGYLVTSGLLVWVALVIIGGRSWWQQVVVAVVLAGGSFSLFGYVLGVPLPGWGF